MNTLYYGDNLKILIIFAQNNSPSLTMPLQILEASIRDYWAVYLLWLLVSASGSFLGVWIRELIKGDVNKKTWFAQESWREKYRLYMLLITSCDEIGDSLLSVIREVQNNVLEPLPEEKTFSDWLAAFPKHRDRIDRATKAYDQFRTAEIGTEVMLNRSARTAFKDLKLVHLETAHRSMQPCLDRIKLRCDAAQKAKKEFIAAAKVDLHI